MQGFGHTPQPLHQAESLQPVQRQAQKPPGIEGGINRSDRASHGLELPVTQPVFQRGVFSQRHAFYIPIHPPLCGMPCPGTSGHTRPLSFGGRRFISASRLALCQNPDIAILRLRIDAVAIFCWRQENRMGHVQCRSIYESESGASFASCTFRCAAPRALRFTRQTNRYCFCRGARTFVAQTRPPL